MRMVPPIRLAMRTTHHTPTPWWYPVLRRWIIALIAIYIAWELAHIALRVAVFVRVCRSVMHNCPF